MKAVEFIEMQKQDIETHNDKVILSEVVAAMAEMLESTPDAEIDHTKTAEDCYKQMYEHAKKNKSNNAYVFTPTGTLQFIRKYLGLPETYEPQASAPVKTEKKRRSLEDFF
ncbi:MAG: hypothetical protein IJV85_06070 [Clostridia bacterium]|nr:hypothetical protein [Clostridia bacterium]